MNELEIIRSDEYLNNFIIKNSLSDEFVLAHINEFKRVYESRNKCLNCRGLYMCAQASKGERLDFNFAGVLFEEIEYCEYLKDVNKVKKHINSFVYSDIPEKLSEVDLLNVDLLDESQKQLCGKMLAIAAGKSNKGIYIYGNMGVGKTYLSIAMANSLVKENKKVAFVKCTSFVNEMRRLVVNESENYEDYLEKIKKADYLFLDDIGAETVSSFSRDDVLFNILDYRLENKLCTMFTSNLSKDALLVHYTYDKKDNSSLLRAKRLLERINILSEDFVLDGQNRR